MTEHPPATQAQSPPSQAQPHARLCNADSDEARRQRNIRNARQSTGPRSPQGKAASSRNAVQHGLTARTRLITRNDLEDPGDFDALVAGLRDAYQPEGQLQDDLVERIAHYTWRLRRADRFEVAEIEAGLDQLRDSLSRESRKTRRKRDRRITELRQELGESRAFLDYLRTKPRADPLAHELTFDRRPVVKRIAELHNRVVAEYISDEYDLGGLAQFLAELGFADRASVHGAFITGLESRLEWLQGRLDRRLAEAQDAIDSPSDGPCPEDLTGDVPIPDRLRLVMRYEAGLTRNRERAVAELYRLKAAGWKTETVRDSERELPHDPLSLPADRGG